MWKFVCTGCGKEVVQERLPRKEPAGAICEGCVAKRAEAAALHELQHAGPSTA